MPSTTHWLITGSYYASQLLGILPLYYDNRTGEVHTKPLVTACCAIASCAMFGALPLLLLVDLKLQKINASELHVQTNGLVILIRMLAVLVTVVFNWTKRREFMQTLNDVQRLKVAVLRKWPIGENVSGIYENNLRMKFVWGFLSTILVAAECVDFLQNIYDVKNPFALATVAVMTIAVNVVMTHYYIALLNVSVILTVINEELTRIVKTCDNLSEQRQRADAWTTHCCKLANELDELAVAQHRIHQLAQRINYMYDIQGACVMLTVYMNNVAVMYMVYTLRQHQYMKEQYGQLAWYLIPLVLLVYYVDLKLFTYNMLELGDLYVETGYLLRERQECGPALHARLEESFKNFSLQLAKFPVEMKLVGLFQFDRAMAFSIFASTISNAIVLMQYDYQHNYSK